jgi:hypothetical protein
MDSQHSRLKAGGPEESGTQKSPGTDPLTAEGARQILAEVRGQLAWQPEAAAQVHGRLKRHAVQALLSYQARDGPRPPPADPNPIRGSRGRAPPPPAGCREPPECGREKLLADVLHFPDSKRGG